MDYLMDFFIILAVRVRFSLFKVLHTHYYNNLGSIIIVVKYDACWNFKTVISCVVVVFVFSLEEIVLQRAKKSCAAASGKGLTNNILDIYKK